MPSFPVGREGKEKNASVEAKKNPGQKPGLVSIAYPKSIRMRW